jgi:hypothetical protein
MERLEFVNPNKPPQPQKGVYRWFYEKEGNEITLYVGRAGVRENTLSMPSTLARALSELQRACLSSDPGKLDTDFIVGTAIKFLREKKGIVCKWQHLDNYPRNEFTICKEYRPKLQTNSTRIDSAYRLERPQVWDKNSVGEAEQKLYTEFDKVL